MTAQRRGPLDPEVEAALHLLREIGRAPFELMTVPEARAVYRAGRDTVQLSRLPVYRVVEHALGQARRIKARSYEPNPRGATAGAPALLFFHGGGGVIGDLETHDSICRRLARSSGRIVVAIDYRLAPESRFPAGPDDAANAYGALVGDALAVGIDPANIAIAGDSAGASLAVVAALAAAGQSMPAVGLLLFYPVVDWRGETKSYQQVDGVPITGRTLRWFRDHYLSSPRQAEDWRASPLLAPTLSALPRTFLTSAGHDPLCDEDFEFVARLRECGVQCEHRHLPGQIHGYLTLGRLLGEAQRSLHAAALFLSADADPRHGREMSDE